MRGVRYWGNNEKGEILGVIMRGVKYWGNNERGEILG